MIKTNDEKSASQILGKGVGGGAGPSPTPKV
jgi:hypothetical protein